MNWDLIFGIIGLISGILGIITAVWYFWDKLFPIRKLSWKFVEKATKRIVEKMMADDFSPTLIVGIGRGGAIMSALISGALGHRPMIVIDRKYEWKEGERFENMIFPVDIPKSFLERVLLVAGEVHSGNTMKMYYEHFKNLGAKSIRRVSFFYEKGATVKLEYIGLESSKKNVRMPWMITKHYIRADRSPHGNVQQ